MLTYNDCLGLSGLDQEEVSALAKIRHLPEVVALEMGWSLCRTPDGAGTVLVVEDHGLPVDQVAAYAAGDQIHVEDLLAHLAGGPRPEPRTRWAELHQGYQEQAAAMG